VILYGADHGAKGKTSVFVPFFGIPAATVTATHHLARLSGAAVIPFFQRRREGGGYVFRMEAPLANFPSDDPVADAARVNALMERMVREAPAQYLWSYKRFKARPPGAADVY
jgi:KDO2-lipid IV(A) lauroyltransferase